jgi:hypothetical protein
MTTRTKNLKKLQRLEALLDDRRSVLNTSDRWALAKMLEHLIYMRTALKAKHG